MTKLPKDHPLWPVIYMVVGAGCVSLVMIATANDLTDLSELRNTVGGAALTGLIGFAIKRFQA